jgi:hypothetical protein
MRLLIERRSQKLTLTGEVEEFPKTIPEYEGGF